VSRGSSRRPTENTRHASSGRERVRGDPRRARRGRGDGRSSWTC